LDANELAPFRDRFEAGRDLPGASNTTRSQRRTLLALPRGGVRVINRALIDPAEVPPESDITCLNA
jgi:hypothetical protein